MSGCHQAEKFNTLKTRYSVCWISKTKLWYEYLQYDTMPPSYIALKSTNSMWVPSKWHFANINHPQGNLLIVLSKKFKLHNALSFKTVTKHSSKEGVGLFSKVYVSQNKLCEFAEDHACVHNHDTLASWKISLWDACLAPGCYKSAWTILQFSRAQKKLNKKQDSAIESTGSHLNERWNLFLVPGLILTIMQPSSCNQSSCNA